MFEINENLTVNVEKVLNTNLYIIDDFYKNPYEIVDLLLDKSSKLNLWKYDEKPSYNGIYFEDKRHIFNSEDLIPAYNYLSELCGQKPIDDPNLVMTNLTRFRKSNFNDYENNYWWPHIDDGYNGIVYLNEGDSSCGTNMYKNLYIEEEPPNIPEHYQPWRNKNYYEVIKVIECKFNRLVLFDGHIAHGMRIVNDEYFSDQYRLNQVFFFCDNV